MTAYIIVEVEVTDPVGYEDYQKQVSPSLAAYNGRFVVRGGACETMVGINRIQRSQSAATAHRQHPDDRGGGRGMNSVLSAKCLVLG